MVHISPFPLHGQDFAIIPPATFIILNYVSYRLNIFKSMEMEEKGNLGTIYFPISLSVLVWLSWDTVPHLGGIGIMAMTWEMALLLSWDKDGESIL